MLITHINVTYTLLFYIAFGEYIILYTRFKKLAKTKSRETNYSALFLQTSYL